MRNLFTPVFTVCLLFLVFFHSSDTVNHEAVAWINGIVLSAGLGCFVLKKYKACYVFVVFFTGLLIGGRFIEEKAAFYHTIDTAVTVPGDQYITLEGMVKIFPEIRNGHSIVFLEVHRMEWDRAARTVNVNVRLKINGDLGHLYRGDRVAVDARIYRGAFNRNFFTNPMEHLRLVRRTHFNGFCKSGHLVTVLEKTNGFWRFIGAWRNKIRAAIEKSYNRGSAGHGENRALDRRGVLLQAVLTGERGKLSNRQKEGLMGAGVYHLLAISGAHIGIIALGCLTLLKWLNITLKTRYIVTGLVLMAFLVLSGFKISAERAVFMAVLVFIARIFYLEVDILNIISFCGVLLLARNPAAFLDAGFILTFTLTAVIVLGRKVFPPLLKLTGPDIFEEEPSYAAEWLSASLSASLAALPLSLFFFKRYSFSGLPAGLLLIPLTGVIIGCGIILILLAPLSSFFSQYLLGVMDIPLRLFFLISGFFSRTLDLNIFRASPSIFLVATMPVIFWLLSVSRTTVQKIALFSIMLLLCLSVTLNLFPYSPDRLEVFYLDVGQGDAQIVVFPGGDALLIDGGGVYYSDFQVGRNILLPFILQKRIRIRWVAVSHYHADHMRGIVEIIAILKPEELWLSSETPGETLYRELIKNTPSATRIRKISAPFELTIGNCRVQWLHPPEFIHARRAKNRHSQVIKVSGGFHSFLFTGDIEIETEEELVARACESLQADVLKVPHHGSATSSTRVFLDCVEPGLAIFSYALRNRFGFPHKKAGATYKRKRIPSISTANRGGIRLISLPEKIEIQSSK
jgi:competence protein ComEC